MARLNTPDPHAAERERDLALVQSNSFITTATTMLLGLLAGIAESKSRPASNDTPHHHGADDAAIPVDTHDVQPLPAGDHLPQAHADVHHDSGSALIETATIARPTYVMPINSDHVTTGTTNITVPASHHEPIATAPIEHAIAPPPAEPSHFGSDITSQLSQLGSTLSHTIDDAVASILHAAPSVDTAATLLNSVLSIPEGAASSLVSATFANHTPSAVGEIIDTASLTHVDLPLAPLPLIGQAHTDGQDHHDGAFSAIGIHHF